MTCRWECYSGAPWPQLANIQLASDRAKVLITKQQGVVAAGTGQIVEEEQEQEQEQALALQPQPASFNYIGLTRPEGVRRNRRPSNRRKVRTLASGSHRTRRSPLVFNVAEKLIVPPDPHSHSHSHPSSQSRSAPPGL
uniref:HDC17468 n=1 Tax=Drosophila melanogaster TaxID=7227 RepID=Q6IIN9_DROME|nr:TPA_inf: HDC17468 [Drosophila melanogaster]